MLIKHYFVRASLDLLPWFDLENTGIYVVMRTSERTILPLHEEWGPEWQIIETIWNQSNKIKRTIESIIKALHATCYQFHENKESSTVVGAQEIGCNIETNAVSSVPLASGPAALDFLVDGIREFVLSGILDFGFASEGAKTDDCMPAFWRRRVIRFW